MPRIRTRKPEWATDEKLSPLDPTTRLVWLFLISHADDEGRHLDNVKAIDGVLFSQTDDTAKQALEALAGLGLILRGRSASGQAVIEIANWKRHQKIQHPNLKSC